MNDNFNATFKDHFSDLSDDYARYRPIYGDAVFDWLASQSPATTVCWDCATGSGQAAVSLARHFDKVIATDASEEQVRNAINAERVEYRVARAEESALDDASSDLVTVAQALHWFDINAFFIEVERVLVPGGLLAILSYSLFQTDSAIDEVIDHLYRDILDQDWPPERRLIEQGYADITLPFPELETPSFSMFAQWDLSQLTGYLNTWSAVKRYTNRTGQSPVGMISESLQSAWGDPANKHRIEWPMTVRVARKPA